MAVRENADSMTAAGCQQVADCDCASPQNEPQQTRQPSAFCSLGVARGAFRNRFKGLKHGVRRLWKVFFKFPVTGPVPLVREGVKKQHQPERAK